jgi:hypothetical protein
MPEFSFLLLQESLTGPYIEPRESSPQTPTIFLNLR